MLRSQPIMHWRHVPIVGFWLKGRPMKRTQTKAIERDLEKKMVLLSGPRQVGNTYLARSIMEGFRTPQHPNHDNAQDQAIIGKQA